MPDLERTSPASPKGNPLCAMGAALRWRTLLLTRSSKEDRSTRCRRSGGQREAGVFKYKSLHSTPRRPRGHHVTRADAEKEQLRATHSAQMAQMKHHLQRLHAELTAQKARADTTTCELAACKARRLRSALLKGLVKYNDKIYGNIRYMKTWSINCKIYYEKQN